MKSTSNQWTGLELRHLLALQAVAKHGSFHKAAAHLNYTQSGVSQQVAALERIVGERLVERPGGSRPLRLTEAGEVVLHHAQAVCEQITAAQADVSALRAGNAGVLRVGSFQSISAKVVPALMKRLAQDWPSLDIELTQTTSDGELFALLEDGQLDITFAVLPIPEGPFDVVELFVDPFVVMVAADSELALRGEPLSMRELGDLPLIAARGCRDTSQEAQMRELGFEPNVVHRSDDNGTVQGLVAAGAGAAVVARQVAESSSGGNVAILELDEPLPPRRVALSWRSDRELPPARPAFVQAVRDTCSELGLRSTTPERASRLAASTPPARVALRGARAE